MIRAFAMDGMTKLWDQRTTVCPRSLVNFLYSDSYTKCPRSSPPFYIVLYEMGDYFLDKPYINGKDFLDAQHYSKGCQRWLWQWDPSNLYK